MTPCVLNVATGRYVRGQQRLKEAFDAAGGVHIRTWCDVMPPKSPSHLDKPYAFKAHAIKDALDAGYTTILWADSCILPIAPLDPLWERIERDGYWISRNGFRNSEWTADTAIPDLFPELSFHEAKKVNHEIEHVVATSFGLDLRNPIGKAIFDEYYRLAQTLAFCGPWTGGIGIQHRHDQTALSVAAWRAGAVLSSPPDVFCYRGGENETTTIVADGAY